MFKARIKTAHRRQRGSAFILTVVLSVLLAVIGVFFVTASRVNDMAAGASADQYQLESAAEAVTGMISNVLVEDLYGPEPNDLMQQNLLAEASYKGMLPDYDNLAIVNEPWDSPVDDQWLADIEPYNADPGGYDFYWRYISDLTGTLTRTLVPEPVGTDAPPAAANQPADADGDGVTDSRWFMLDNIFTSNGENCYAAVRIIDNCGMLNLNTAYAIAPHSEAYITGVDYYAFLRGGGIDIPDGNPDGDRSNPGRIMDARYANIDDIEDLPSNWWNEIPSGEAVSWPQKRWQGYVFDIENPDPMCKFFDISDELEMRNRYLLTSLAIARFERHESLSPEIDGIGYYTFDYERGHFEDEWNVQLRVKRIPFTYEDFYNGDGVWQDEKNNWLWRVDHRNFDSSTRPQNSVNAWKYDRRHVCTFYSFDRQVRRREYPYIEPITGLVDTAKPHTGLYEINKAIIDYNMEEWNYLFPPPFLPFNASPSHCFDIVSGDYWSKVNVLRMLYGLRAYYIANGHDVSEAAQKSAQFVANMIDYCDTPEQLSFVFSGQTADGLCYIDDFVVKDLLFVTTLKTYEQWDDDLNMNNTDFGLTETVYGYEKQPFISEIARKFIPPNPPSQPSAIKYYAIELSNPYEKTINLEDWEVKVDGTTVKTFLSSDVIEAKQNEIPGRLILADSAMNCYDGSVAPNSRLSPISGLQIDAGQTVTLTRPNPTGGSDIVVDKTTPYQSIAINTPSSPAVIFFTSSQRDERDFRMADRHHYGKPPSDAANPLPSVYPITLGFYSGFEDPNAHNYALPVADKGEGSKTLESFVSAVKVGNTGSRPITDYIGSLSHESKVRFDLTDSDQRKVFEYVTILNRDEGTLPGRININTAPMYVMRAAIPLDEDLNPATPAEIWNWNELAEAIYNKRYASGNSFETVSELIDLPEFNTPRDGSDFENTVEKHSILSQVFNKYTVRSDVFTAYILVRLGEEGPMKRWIAIFDRSGVTGPDDRPKIVAMHPVPDPR